MVPEPQPPREWSEPIALFALTGLLVVGIAVGAFRHTRTLRSQARAQAEAQLAAVSDLKVRELSLWRHERQVDATAFNNLVGFPALVRRVLENPLDRGSEQALLTGLQAFLAQGEFDQARLLDATGRERLSLPASAPPMSSAIHQVAMAALVSGRAVLQDFYRSPIDQKIYLKWLVPVTDDREPTRRIGLLALRIDPNRSLYPYILHWPTPSTSAETLLVRREGQEAVYLNDLRFHPGAALELRVPLHQSRIPAALAVLGQTGITEGPDYRGTAVLADLRPVPDSPWFLVTRMDRSEVFAPYRKDLRETALIAGALSLALVGGAVAIWRHQRMADFRNRYAVERESAWLKQVITRSREEIYIFATDTLQFLFVNAGAMQNLGYSLDELSRMTPVDFKPEFTEARFRAAIQPLLSGQQELLTFQTVHRRKNGTKYPVEVRLQCVDRGSDTVFLAIIRDITERRQAERVILTANQKLDLHAQQTPLAVIEWDLAFRVTHWNPAAERIFGFSAAEAMGQHASFIIPASAHPLVEPVMGDLLKGLGGQHTSNANIHKDGHTLQCEWYNTTLRDEEGRVIGIASLVDDITECKLAEEALSLSEQKFRALFENLAEGVALHELVADESGKVADYRILDVNQAYQQHTGIARASAAGRLATEVYATSAPPFLDAFAKVAMGGEPCSFEAYFAPLDKHFHISVVSPQLGQFATVFEDVTDRKRREEELKQKNAEMERFTYMISHDPKSPLVTIRTFLSYLEEDLDQGKAERAAKDMGFIRDATGKMARLLEDLLEVSRVGRVMNHPVQVSSHDLAREALKAVAGAIATRGVAVQMTGSPVTLFGDRPRLEEVWQNLVENAVKYMGDAPAPRIELGREGSGPETVFFVRDNGMGIDPRFQAKVFGLFEQLDAASEGTGLGLALVKRIVELYEGRVWVESEGLGRGTCIRFTLPLALNERLDGAR